ncbi:hypothetical protein M426DRAFT_139906 [Hypoxylon sp. CI-4A]|nr:hypothetical protein M426DRAFT_139906 [Hypoxylon sp. CI-4A]
MSSESELEDLIRQMTAYDNSKEPEPAFNDPVKAKGMIIPFLVASTLCVAFRLYSRAKLRCLGWDDLFVVLFRISATIGSIFIILALNDGFGKHVLAIGFENFERFQLKFYVALATYTISTTLMKLCLLTQYLRIFEVGSRSRLICWIGLVICGLWGAAFSFCALFPCFPVYGFWDWQTSSTCYGFGSRVSSQTAGTFAAHTGTNVVLDAMVLAIIVPLYFRKDTAWKQRLGIGILLLLGVLVLLISIWVLQTIVENKAGTYPVLDPTWYGPKSIILAAIEVDLASICASIPTFYPILRQGFLGNIFVTQEVHVTRQHRRLSGDSAMSGDAAGPFELLHRRSGSAGSFGAALGTTIEIARVDSKSSTHHNNHYHENFAMKGIPHGMHDKEMGVESEIRSDGQKGFERQQERMRMASIDSHRSDKMRKL